MYCSDFIDGKDNVDLFHSIESWVLGFGSSLWTLFFLFVFCVVDGFLPTLPSETLIIVLGAPVAQSNGPNVHLLTLTGAFGAIFGDQFALGIGHRYNAERIRLLRERKGQAAVRFAQKGPARRGPLYIIAICFIPIGRVAVNLIVGATGCPRHELIPLTLPSGLTWSTYSALIGIVSGYIFNGHPILSMLVGVSGGIALGVVINIVIKRTTSGPPIPEEVFGGAARTSDDVQNDGSEGDGTKVCDVQGGDARDEASDA